MALGVQDAAQQKDNLCGPFWAARILREAGVGRWDGEEVDEDLLARAAGTLLPDLPAGACVPPGAASLPADGIGLEVVAPARAGTDPASLAAAIVAASGGALACVGLRGSWTGDRVARLVEEGEARGARLVANLRTGRLWGSRPPVAALRAELAGERTGDVQADWDVGHFCALTAVVQGRGGALVVVEDSYPSLGWQGHYLQPPRGRAAPLERGDGREGGVLAAGAASARGELESLAARLGLTVGFWDNGTRREQG